MSAFDLLLDAFAARLGAATAVCAVIETDESNPLPEGTPLGIVIALAEAQPQQLGGIQGNPVDWVVDVSVACQASVQGSSARAAANTLAAAAYARLAATPALGMDPKYGTYIGEPRITWAAEKAATRIAVATLTYSVALQTTSLTLE